MAHGTLDLAQITRVLAERGLYVRELAPIRRDLESVFLELTADEHLGASPDVARRRGPLRTGDPVTAVATASATGACRPHRAVDAACSGCSRGDQPAAQPPVHPDRLVIGPAGAGRVPAGGHEALRRATGGGAGGSQSAYEEDPADWEENERTCDSSGRPARDCRYPEPQLTSSPHRPFGEVAAESLQLSIYLVALAALMMAGSFIGAEYSSGSIANWLSFLPRRGRVFASKLITVAAFSALASAVGDRLA